MTEYDDPITLCGDCGLRASGSVTTKPIEDGPRECEWCGEPAPSPVKLTERQEDPGLLDWQRVRDEFAEWMREHESTTRVRQQTRIVDFTIGDAEDDWPEYGKDDELNAVRSSSVNFMGAVSDAVARSMDIHLPPTREELEDDIAAALDVPSGFKVFYGTAALGGVTPAPPGVITPHIKATTSLDENAVRDAVEQAIRVYEEVYESGRKAIKRIPEEHRP